MGSVSLGQGSPLQGLLAALAGVQAQRQQNQQQGLAMMQQGFVPNRPAPAENWLQKLLTPGPSLGPEDYAAAPWHREIAESDRAERAAQTTEQGQILNYDLGLRGQEIDMKRLGLTEKMADLDREVARYQAETARMLGEEEIGLGQERNRLTWQQIQGDERLRDRAMDIQYELEKQGLDIKFMEYKDGKWYGVKTDNGVVMFQTEGMGAGPSSVQTIPDTGKRINAMREYMTYLGMQVQAYTNSGVPVPKELLEKLNEVTEAWWQAQGMGRGGGGGAGGVDLSGEMPK